MHCSQKLRSLNHVISISSFTKVYKIEKKCSKYSLSFWRTSSLAEIIPSYHTEIIFRLHASPLRGRV